MIVDQFEYAEFNVGVHFFCFIPETPFLLNEGKRSAVIVFVIIVSTGVETLK